MKIRLSEQWKKGDIAYIDSDPYPERYFLIAAVIFSVAACSLRGWTLTGDAPVWATVVRDIFVYVTMLILVLFFYGRYRIVLSSKRELQNYSDRELAAFKSLITRQIEISYSLMNRTRQSIFHAGGDMYPRRFIYRTQDLQKLLQDSMQNVMESLHDILSSHLKIKFPNNNESIAFSVKAVVSEDIARQICVNATVPQSSQHRYVITLARFQTAKDRKKREVKEVLYSIEKNSAFRKILKGDDKAFVSNDLNRMSKDNGYINEHEDWRSFYNATLLVPIGHQDDGGEPLQFGLLTVDSRNDGNLELFDELEAKRIMSFGADLLALVFLNLELFDSLETPPPDGKE